MIRIVQSSRADEEFFTLYLVLARLTAFVIHNFVDFYNKWCC